jgi:hypothetical protein
MISMSQPDDLRIERSTDLDMDVDELWLLISTAEGWKSWLVDDADVVIVAAADGTASNDGLERVVRIDSVTAGRAVGFSWWDRDDPSSASYVQLNVVALPGGRSQLHISERFVGATASTMSSSASVSWEVRIISLWLMAAWSAVMA